jgi:hypothetical protein
MSPADGGAGAPGGDVAALGLRADRARVYEVVLQEGRPADILAYVEVGRAPANAAAPPAATGVSGPARTNVSAETLRRFDQYTVGGPADACAIGASAVPVDSVAGLSKGPGALACLFSRHHGVPRPPTTVA